MASKIRLAASCSGLRLIGPPNLLALCRLAISTTRVNLPIPQQSCPDAYQSSSVICCCLNMKGHSEDSASKSICPLNTELADCPSVACVIRAPTPDGKRRFPPSTPAALPWPPIWVERRRKQGDKRKKRPPKSLSTFKRSFDYNRSARRRRLD